jgi:uncharacterized protein (DUF1330 family)
VPAYVIANVDVRDPEGYREYVERVPEIVERFGGRYLARGGRAEALEGGFEPKRLVILEFPSYEQAKAWHEAAEYAPIREIRTRFSKGDLVLVEGLEEQP